VAERDTDVYRQARRIGRLTLAAEMQWELLPGRACARAEFAVGAQLEPAYAVRGDNFDWSSDAHRLTLSIINGMGDGIHASLLTHLAVGAPRNARRAGLPVADQARLADQALYAQHHADQHVSALLLSFDLATGSALAVDAGSPRMCASSSIRSTAVPRRRHRDTVLPGPRSAGRHARRGDRARCREVTHDRCRVGAGELGDYGPGRADRLRSAQYPGAVEAASGVP
jgi:hypothetical protein